MKKKILLPVMVGLLMVLATVGVTYAFFNYTRTGSANTVRTGTINFTSSQTTINLSNVFPISSSDVSTDTDNVGTATITVTGDTTYDKGIEYLISATNVTNTVGTKNLPISISATTSGTLGTSDDDYFDNRETSTNHIYKVLAKDTISNDDQLMVGYIAKGATGINGTITIKTYIDKDNILISDTYPEGEQVIDGVTYYNGTPTTNKTVFTTEEWNSLNTSEISFQVKVEANEGIWVIDRERNDMKAFTSEITSVKSSITEVNFIKASADEINSHANLIDLTDENGNGMVKAWIENNKLYIASPGTTYFPSNCSNLFASFSNVTKFVFGNINTKNVTNMELMFAGCSKLNTIDLHSFNTINVKLMNQMFVACSSLSEIDLSYLNTQNVTNMNAIFGSCTNLQNANISNMGSDFLVNVQYIFGSCLNLTNVNMHGFNFGTSSLSGLLYNNNKLETLDLSDANISKVTDMSGTFYGSNKLSTIYVSNTWDVSNVTNSNNMFYNCTSLKGGGSPQTTYDANHVDKEYARIDGGANSSTPGYLTLKTN